MCKELASIVIPTYKGSDVIKKAVESALHQTYTNIEIIVVDDNGKGTEEQIKTEEAMNAFSSFENVKYIAHEKNINGSAARNTGIKASKGSYIALLDDDDEFRENNIQKHIATLKETSSEYGVSYCGMRLIAQNKSEQIIMPSYNGDILFDFLCGKIRIGSSLIVVKREVIDYVKGFDETFRRHQDWEFLVRVLDKYKCAKVENVGVNKHVIQRNSAKDPKTFEKNRLYYLEKMEYIICKFSKKEQKKIYDAHYFSIGKEYLRNKKLSDCIKWTFKTSNPLKSLLKYVSIYIRYKKKSL